MSKSVNLKILLILLVIITRVVLIYKGISSGFVFSNIAVSALIDSSGHIQFNPFLEASNTMNQAGNSRSTRLLVTLLLPFLHKITNIPLEVLQFLPLPGLLLPIIGYILAKQLLKSEFLAFIFGSFLALEPDISSLTYNSNIQGYGYIYYFLIILFLDPLISEKKISKNIFNSKHYLLLITFFLMTMTSYYGAEFYSLLHILMLSSLIYIVYNYSYFSDKINTFSKSLRTLRSLLLIFIILVVIFEPIINKLFRIILYGYCHNVLDFFIQYLNYMKATVATSTLRVYAYIDVPFYIHLMNLILYALIFIPIFYHVFNMFSKKRFLNLEANFISILFTGVINVIMYIVYGGYLDQKFFLLLYPLLALMGVEQIIHRVKKMPLKKIYSVVILVLVALKFVLFSTGPWAALSLSQTLKRNDDFLWLANHSKPRIDLYLTSIEAAGPLLLAYTSRGRHEDILIYLYSSAKSAEFLYTGHSESLEYLRKEYSFGHLKLDYILILIDDLYRPFHGNNWILLQPLENINNLFNTYTVNAVFYGYRIILLKCN